MKQVYVLILALCASVAWATDDALSGKFTVSAEGKQVQFAPVNIGPYTWDEANANIPAGWRLLTSEEWQYLLREEDPKDPESLPINAGQATIVTQHGLVILPDNWTGELSFTSSPNNWTTNSYNDSQWNLMAEAGAVFLPCDGNAGDYWSATSKDANDAYGIHFYETAIQAEVLAPRSSSYAVRLVKDVQKTPTGIENDGMSASLNDGMMKILRDGQIVIVRDGKTYSVLGQEVTQ